jgi:multidrug efflux pump subunit AcrA (membrane-fusion protein)
MLSKKFILALLALVLIISAVAGYTFFLSQPEPTPEPVGVNTVQQLRVVSAEAFVVPARRVELTFEAAGRIASIEVNEGDEVKRRPWITKQPGLSMTGWSMEPRPKRSLWPKPASPKPRPA